MLEAYQKHVEERAALGIPPLPLDATQTSELIELLKKPSAGSEQLLLELITERIPPGVDEAAYVKAAFLSAVCDGETNSPLIDAPHAVRLLGDMQGGYNVGALVAMLERDDLGEAAAEALKNTLLIFDAFHDVAALADKDNIHAVAVLRSWAEAEWFLRRPEVPERLPLTVFYVPGETNTDDLSPAPEAWSRPDIPLHALCMYKNPRPGVDDALRQLAELRELGHPLALVGDVLGTGSSRKSATNSVLWHIGEPIPHVPNKNRGGVCIGGQIAPIFFNTLEDSGALPLEADLDVKTGDAIEALPYEGLIRRLDGGETLAEFTLKSDTLLDEVRSGGRINLIIGRGLVARAREHLGLEPSTVFRNPAATARSAGGFTLAQKMVGRACGVDGVPPGTYCEPRMSMVGSQDTTGPMTRDELKDLACLGFSADMVMQSFCHTAAYPKPVDIETQHQLPDFIVNRGGVSLRPGDGIIHSWMNRMLLPDGVGTGGDSHTRFPLGISFPAGSGMVAFAAAVGVMPLDMPESVRVRFHGEMRPHITLRDLVNAIPYVALQNGLLSIDKKGKKNVFSGRIMEIEGLPQLKIEQAFEFADASAERSCAGCTVLLDPEPIAEFLRSNITLLRWMIAEGYRDARSLERRARQMEEWLQNPELLRPDPDGEYFAEIDIDLDQIDEPLLACPNDPDDIKTLSAVKGEPIDEVFIGSCMTNIGHYRAAGRILEHGEALATRLWIAPPTRMDEHQLMEEGFYNIYGRIGARTEMPGCSLCMGNQARVAAGARVVSTSTRNFPNRLGDGADVYLASAELAAISALLGRLPDIDEYRSHLEGIDPLAKDVYRYLNFDGIARFQHGAEAAKKIPLQQMEEFSAGA